MGNVNNRRIVPAMRPRNPEGQADDERERPLAEQQFIGAPDEIVNKIGRYLINNRDVEAVSAFGRVCRQTARVMRGLREHGYYGFGELRSIAIDGVRKGQLLVRDVATNYIPKPSAPLFCRIILDRYFDASIATAIAEAEAKGWNVLNNAIACDHLETDIEVEGFGHLRELRIGDSRGHTVTLKHLPELTATRLEVRGGERVIIEEGCPGLYWIKRRQQVQQLARRCWMHAAGGMAVVLLLACFYYRVSLMFTMRMMFPCLR